jgi:alkaline phosphatase D
MLLGMNSRQNMRMRILLPALLVLAALFGISLAEAQSRIGNPRLLQGPMVGAVTTDSVIIWCRANEPWDVEILYDTEYPFRSPQRSGPTRASKDDDYIVRIELTGLEPDTRYYYRVLVNNRPERLSGDIPELSFSTAPAGPTKFRVAIGSCVEFNRFRDQPVWHAIYRSRPDFFIWLGDNIYGDTRDPDTLMAEYMRQREVGSLQPVLHNVSHLAIWDDHDYGLNNHDRTNPIREEALEVFKKVWANPSYGLPETPGVFFKYSYGGVDFFLLDNRYYADPQTELDAPDKTLLGEKQLAWLKEGLLQSEAPFKVLVNGSGWSMAKGPGQDSFGNRLFERNRLFDFIRDHEIGGVVLVSGDTHVGELNCIPWSERGGYDFYELVSSPLASVSYMRYALDEAEIRLREPLMAINFGVLDFDLTGEVPELRFSLMTELGRYAWTPQHFTVRADELVNGVESWKEKIDPRRLQRMDLSRPVLDVLPDYLKEE